MVLVARGGSRPGAGRKIGSINRFSRETLDQARATGELPLDYFLTVMRDAELDTRTRLDAAKAAAPYLHHKLSSTSIDVWSSTSKQLTHEEWLTSIELND